MGNACSTLQHSMSGAAIHSALSSSERNHRWVRRTLIGSPGMRPCGRLHGRQPCLKRQALRRKFYLPPAPGWPFSSCGYLFCEQAPCSFHNSQGQMLYCMDNPRAQAVAFNGRAITSRLSLSVSVALSAASMAARNA